MIRNVPGILGLIHRSKRISEAIPAPVTAANVESFLRKIAEEFRNNGIEGCLHSFPESH